MGINDLRAILNNGQSIVSSFGLCPYTVSIRTQTFTTNLGNNATLSSQVTTTITPTPNVDFVSSRPAEYSAQEPLALSSGEQQICTYRISGIVPYNGSIGYTRAQLMPAVADTTKRVVVLMTGPNLSDSGEVFKVIDYNETSLEIILTVETTTDY